MASTNPNPPYKRPGYKWVQVDTKTIPMQADHLPTPPNKTRCQLCWQLGVSTPVRGRKSKDHFCRWNIENESPQRDMNPRPLVQPLYAWVKTEDQ